MTGEFIVAAELEHDIGSAQSVKQVIMHLDLDAFFAACEEVRYPEFKGKPLVIGADPRGGKGRGVVSTANYEARRYSIKSAMPISWAYRCCPQAIFLPVDMPYYVSIAERIMRYLRSLAPKCERAGIDEMYLDLSDLSYEEAVALARRIQHTLLQREQISCTIGIAPNKLIAKIASDFQKPHGLTIVRPYEVVRFLAPLPVRKLYGIGPKTAARLHELGIKTVVDIQRIDLSPLANAFGVNGARTLKEEAFGIDAREVSEGGEAKSCSAETTFDEDTRDRMRISETLNTLTEEVYQTLAAQNIAFRTITSKVRYADFETHTHQKTYKAPIANLNEASALAHELLTPFLDSEKRIRLIGVRASQFVRPHATPSA